jgi:cell division protein FtsQ
MGLYQGRALARGGRRDEDRAGHGGGPRRPGGRRTPAGRRGGRARALRPGRILWGVVGLGLVVATAVLVPWRPLRTRFAVVQDVRVEGARYLDAARVAETAGLRAGEDLFDVDCERARQSLLLDPRIADAEVGHAWLRAVRVRIVEREPVMLVRHGEPWEVDSSGVLLSPLARGVVADVPLLTGPDFSRLRAGTQVRTVEVRRGLAWVRALGAPDLQLAGEVSEVDVAAADSTAILLMDGTRVLAPAWPPQARVLSALRVVLKDLPNRQVRPGAVDLRFEDLVVVQPARGVAPASPAPGPTSGVEPPTGGTGAVRTGPDGVRRSG